MYSLPSKHDHLSERKMWRHFYLRSSHICEITRSKDSEVSRLLYCSSGFGPIGHDKVQSVKLLANNWLSHLRNQAVTLHFLTSYAVRNNIFFQMYRKLTRLDLPMISQENLRRLGLCLVFHLPCSWARSHFWPGGRSLAVAHQRNSEKMAQLNLNHKVKVPRHLQQRNSTEFHSAFSLCTLFFGKQCSFWHTLAVWVHKWIYICFKAKPWLRTIYSVLGM